MDPRARKRRSRSSLEDGQEIQSLIGRVALIAADADERLCFQALQSASHHSLEIDSKGPSPRTRTIQLKREDTVRLERVIVRIARGVGQADGESGFMALRAVRHYTFDVVGCLDEKGDRLQVLQVVDPGLRVLPRRLARWTRSTCFRVPVLELVNTGKRGLAHAEIEVRYAYGIARFRVIFWGARIIKAMADNPLSVFLLFFQPLALTLISTVHFVLNVAGQLGHISMRRGELWVPLFLTLVQLACPTVFFLLTRWGGLTILAQATSAELTKEALELEHPVAVLLTETDSLLRDSTSWSPYR